VNVSRGFPRRWGTGAVEGAMRVQFEGHDGQHPDCHSRSRGSRPRRSVSRRDSYGTSSSAPRSPRRFRARRRRATGGAGPREWPPSRTRPAVCRCRISRPCAGRRRAPASRACGPPTRRSRRPHRRSSSIGSPPGFAGGAVTFPESNQTERTSLTERGFGRRETRQRPWRRLCAG
jgi:hypothetical protein